MQQRLDKNEILYQDYNLIKQKLYELHEKEFLKKAVGIHTKVKIENERTNLFHIVKHIKEQQRRYISKISQPDGSVVRTSGQIIREFENHYTSIFGSDSSSIPDTQSLLVTRQKNLKEADNNLLNANISEDEVRKAINSTAKGKSPGCDGIPYEFYKIFWNCIKDEFLEVINEMFAKGPERLQQLGTVILIPKTKSPSDVTGFRPITLLCTDYKLLAKVLADRLNLVLGVIINDSQVLIIIIKCLF